MPEAAATTRSAEARSWLHAMRSRNSPRSGRNFIMRDARGLSGRHGARVGRIGADTARHSSGRAAAASRRAVDAYFFSSHVTLASIGYSGAAEHFAAFARQNFYFIAARVT